MSVATWRLLAVVETRVHLTNHSFVNSPTPSEETNQNCGIAVPRSGTDDTKWTLSLTT